MKYVFWKTISFLKESKVVRWVFGSIFGIVALTIGLFNMFKLSPYSLVYLAVGILFTVIATFLIVFIRFWNSDIRPRIHGDLIQKLNRGFADIHAFRKIKNILLRFQDVPEEKIPKEMQEVLLKMSPEFMDENALLNIITMCDLLKQHFDTQTKSYCCVSIKLIKRVKNEMIDLNSTVYSLCRDTHSQQKRDEKGFDKLIHPIFQNTPFLNIAEKMTINPNDKSNVHNMDDIYYIEGNVRRAQKLKKYRSTSEPLCKKGRMPYKSELVVPLIPLSNEYDSQRKTIGYLCVDSNKKRRFGTKYDVSILQGVSDGIYDIIHDDIMKLN